MTARVLEPSAHMKMAIGVLLAVGAIASEVQAQDDAAVRIRKRLDVEMKDALEKSRKGMLEFVAKELAAAGIGERSLSAQIRKFADNLVDDSLHSRLKRLLLSKDGRELVEEFMSEQNMEELETLVESYFEKNKNGKYRVREEFAEVLEQMLDSVAPVDAPKAAPAGKDAGALGLKCVALEDGDRLWAGVPGDLGVKITDVTEGGPAAKAGLRKHDIITLIGGKRLTMANVEEVVKALPVNSDINLTYHRGKSMENAKLTIEDRRPK